VFATVSVSGTAVAGRANQPLYVRLSSLTVRTEQGRQQDPNAMSNEGNDHQDYDECEDGIGHDTSTVSAIPGSGRPVFNANIRR
jgi:hypothetical protein